VTADEVYPDLAFALPPPPIPSRTTGAVGVGVMAYRGGNDDRGRSEEIYRRYVETMGAFVCWLVDEGRDVRLFIGDRMDEDVVAEIIADLRSRRPELDPARIAADPAATLDDLMRQMSTVDAVIATRYHNVLCALKLSKPTISVGYAAKNDVLMDGMGLGEFCQSARSVELRRLVEQFRTLEARRDQLMSTLTERNRIMAGRLEHQFSTLAGSVLPAARR
jgi:polysaccharide pyruvyl transferase WcaK-like protein